MAFAATISPRDRCKLSFPAVNVSPFSCTSATRTLSPHISFVREFFLNVSGWCKQMMQQDFFKNAWRYLGVPEPQKMNVGSTGCSAFGCAASLLRGQAFAPIPSFNGRPNTFRLNLNHIFRSEPTAEEAAAWQTVAPKQDKRFAAIFTYRFREPSDAGIAPDDAFRLSCRCPTRTSAVASPSCKARAHV